MNWDLRFDDDDDNVNSYPINHHSKARLDYWVLQDKVVDVVSGSSHG